MQIVTGTACGERLIPVALSLRSMAKKTICCSHFKHSERCTAQCTCTAECTVYGARCVRTVLQSTSRRYVRTGHGTALQDMGTTDRMAICPCRHYPRIVTKQKAMRVQPCGTTQFAKAFQEHILLSISRYQTARDPCQALSADHTFGVGISRPNRAIIRVSSHRARRQCKRFHRMHN